MSRRHLLAAASASGAAMLIPAAVLAADHDNDEEAATQNFHALHRDIADRAEAERIVRDLIGDRIPREGVVHLTAPDLAENATAVPFTIRVDCAMTEDDYPVSIHLVALENPYPELSRHHFTPACGEAEVSGRCRMAASAPLVVVANMSDGSVATTEAFVEVTGSGCG